MDLLIPKDTVLLSPRYDFARVYIFPVLVEFGQTQRGIAFDVRHNLNAFFFQVVGHICYKA
jgi:hypothetical protein